MTRLEAIIIGLLLQRGLTGYEIIKSIGGSPSLGLRPSAGSVYPALNRLIVAGYVAAEDASVGARPASHFHVTGAGTEAFRQWLHRPIPFGTVEGTEELLLRLVFWRHLGIEEARGMLDAYKRAMEEQIAILEASEPQWGVLPTGQRLSLLNGLMSARTQLAWAERAQHEVDGELGNLG